MLEMLHAVEPPVLYAIGGVIVLAIASLFGLVLFASREETFEDVVAKQKKAQEALLNSLQGGNAKSGKQNRKWNKLKNKKASKVKEQDNEIEIDSGVDDDEPASESVTVSVPPPSISVEEPTPPPTTSKKKKKSKKNKGQQDVSVPSEEKNVEVSRKNTEEEELDVNTGIEEIIAECEEPTVIEEEIDVVSPEEEVEVAPEVSEDELPEELPVENVEVSTEIEEVHQEPEVIEVIETTAPIQTPEPVSAPVEVPQEKKSKKSKKSSQAQQKQGVITNTVDKLEADIENSLLTAEEIQQIMDALLAKQNDLEQWQKPNQKSDPMEQLKKRIAEVEMQFAEERQSAQAIQVKNKELRLELQQERNHRQSIQTEASGRIAQQSKETESIRKRMEEKHMSEMHSANSQISRMQGIIDDGANLHMEMQRLKEDNSHLKNASMMAQQLAEDKQSLMGELTQLQQSNKSLRQELDNIIVHNQQEMQNLQIAKADSENALGQRLQEVNEQLMKVEAHNRSLQQQIEVVEQCKLEQETMQMNAVQQPLAEIEELHTKIDELSTKLSESETHIAQSEASMKLVTEQIQMQSVELEDTRSFLSDAANKLAEQEAEKDFEPVNEEVANLVAKVAEKEQMILVLEQKVATLGEVQKTGQQSPDLVVVTPGDLLGSESMETSESFEEVTADKEYQDELDGKTHEVVAELIVPVESLPEECLPEEYIEEEIVEEETIIVVESVPDESLPEETLPVETSETQLKELEGEVEERKMMEKSLRESLHKIKAEQQKAQEELAAAQHILAERNSIIAEKEAAIATNVAAIAEKNTAIAANETALAAKDAELAEKMVQILQIDNLNTVISEKDLLISQLKEQVARIEETIQEATATTDDSGKEDLLGEMEAVKEELKEKTEAIDQLKTKNNELREKNWKVVDALGIAEKATETKVKEIERSIFKGLKQMFPNIKIPKHDNDFNKLFEEFGEKVAESTAEKSAELKAEISKLSEENIRLTEEIAELKKTNELMVSEENIRLTKEIAELKKTNELMVSEENNFLAGEIEELKKTNELMLASQDEVEKSQEENVHLKKVLTETESMLSRLQTGVDAEVQKWQKKVDEKDVELEDSKKSYDNLANILSKHGYEHENLQTLESNLAAGQKQLMVEKEENTRIKTELQEFGSNLAAGQKQWMVEKEENTRIKTELQELESNLVSGQQQLMAEKEENTRIKTEFQELEKNLAALAKEKEKAEAVVAVSSETELAELNSKLKKTISERDLLIREYKTVKDNSLKLDSDLKVTTQELACKSQEVDNLKEQMESATSVGGSTEKDEVIEKLTIEIGELKEELSQEKDCVIVDIDPDNAENLHKQVEVLSTELESEKKCKANLVSKLHDIEKSYQEETPENDTILNLESKLKSAEQKILELEREKECNTQKTRQDGGDAAAGTSV